MPSRQQIRSRIRSVTSTKQITRAMQMVSASKLRRAQAAVNRPRLYSDVAREMLTSLRQLAQAQGGHELFRDRVVKKRLLIVIGSNRSLAGAYNANILRELIRQIRSDEAAGIQTGVICVGRQIARAAVRLKGVEIVGVYNDLPDQPGPMTLQPILVSAFEDFTEDGLDQADMLYTVFHSTIKQTVQVDRLLPAGFVDMPLDDDLRHVEIEPSLEELIDVTVVRFLSAQLQQAYLDAVASEHAIRMLAMKNATDNANDIIDDLTLEFNNARQAAITQELSEISAGVEALD